MENKKSPTRTFFILHRETLLHIRCGCKLRVVLAHPYVGQAFAELVGLVGLSVIVALVSIVLEVGGFLWEETQICDVRTAAVHMYRQFVVLRCRRFCSGVF